jgi:hypothetical protein
LKCGGQIFAALDQLTPSGVALATELCDRIEQVAPTWPRLNDPRHVLLRQPLLDLLAAVGLNDFRVWPADGPLGEVRYPAFVRVSNRHRQPHRLLDSRSALRQALRRALPGARLSDLLVVEYLHTADEEGRFRKYSAYRIGPAIVRTQLFQGHAWALKAAGDEADMDAAEDLYAYVTGNQHEAWLGRVFELAGISYGRVDYGIANGRPQLWEINLTPWICRRPGQAPRPAAPEVAAVRESARQISFGKLRDAFRALDCSDQVPERSVQLPVALLDGARAERAAEARRLARLAALARFFHAQVLGRPVRALYRKVLPQS